MEFHLRRSVAATLLVAAAGMLPASCARNDSSIFIRGVLVPTRADCTLQISTNPALNLEGTIDAAYAGEYLATVLVENQLVARGNPTSLKTETSGVQLYDAEVQVLDPVSNSAIAQFSVPITGFVDPGVSGTPGVGASDVVMVDAATIQKLSGQVDSSGKVQQVVASVIIRGRTLGGEEVHTQEFLYPISVFHGSTCILPTTGTCVGGMASEMDCRLGIDEPLGTDCSVIYAAQGACKKLHCTTPGDANTAICPSGPPDDSCCQ